MPETLYVIQRYSVPWDANSRHDSITTTSITSAENPWWAMAKVYPDWVQTGHKEVSPQHWHDKSKWPLIMVQKGEDDSYGVSKISVRELNLKEDEVIQFFDGIDRFRSEVFRGEE